MRLPLNASEVQYVLNVMVKAGERIRKAKNILILPEKGIGGTGTAIVTQMDFDTEDFLRENFAKKFPTIGFYSEETAKDAADELEKELVWVVDPIDGTLNFSRGIPLFGISVALFQDHKPVFGSIYFPVSRDMYWAAHGGGAFWNRRRIHFLVRPSTEKPYGAIGTTGLTPIQQGRLWPFFYMEEIQTCKMSCCVYHLVQTAIGHLDFTVAINHALWDYAAGWILVKEAGGVCRQFYHDSTRHKTTPYAEWFVADNPQFVDNVIPRLTPLLINYD